MGQAKGPETHAFRYIFTGCEEHIYHPNELYHILTKKASIKLYKKLPFSQVNTLYNIVSAVLLLQDSLQDAFLPCCRMAVLFESCLHQIKKEA